VLFACLAGDSQTKRKPIPSLEESFAPRTNGSFAPEAESAGSVTTDWTAKAEAKLPLTIDH